MDIGQTTSTCLLLVVLVLVLVSGLGHSLRDVHDMDTIEVEVADNIHHIDISVHHHQILEANLGRIFGPCPIINRPSPLPNKPVHMIAPTPPKIRVFILPPQPPPPPPSVPSPPPPSPSNQ